MRGLEFDMSQRGSEGQRKKDREEGVGEERRAKARSLSKEAIQK